MKSALVVGVLASLCAVLLAQDDDQSQVVNLKKKTIKLQVTDSRKIYEIEPATPLIDYVSNSKGGQIEGCEIQQGELIENFTKTVSFVGNFPLSMHNRWTKWLNYKDAQFLIYREDKFKPFTMAQFSRAGMMQDNLDIDLSIISGKEGDQIKFLRDQGQSTGPNMQKTARSYILVYPNNIIYHEFNFLGKSVKTKVYQTDNQLEVIDAFANHRKVFIVTGNSLELYSVNENIMVKEVEILIPVNSISQIRYTRGKIFLMVRRVEGGMELLANNKFSLENAYTHLKAKSIAIVDSGNQNMVIFVQDDVYGEKGRYYYIENPKVNKSSSLVFTAIPEMKMKYTRAFELKGRIHFIKDNDHAMYTKGSKKAVVTLKNTLPIIGLTYWSYYQYLQEDKFLVVADIGASGNLKIIQVEMTKPRVVCPPKYGAEEKYEKFSVMTSDTEYRFEVVFQSNGSQAFIKPSIIEQVICLLFGIGIAGSIFLWFKKSLNDRDFKRFNTALNKRRLAAGEKIEEDQNEEDILEKIEDLAKEEEYRNPEESSGSLSEEGAGDA